jgi:hypothetical protein
MKKSILLSIILTITTIIYSQQIKVSVAPTINFAPHYKSVQGGPGQNLKIGITSSVDYLFLSDKKLNFGFGLNYHFCQVEFVPNMNTGEMIKHTDKINLVSLRFKSVLNFTNQFYISLDPSIDINLNPDSQQTIGNQTGLGLSLGLGKNIKIKEAQYLNIEPKLWIHNIVSFSKEIYPYRLTTVGLNIGYVFGQKKL